MRKLRRLGIVLRPDDHLHRPPLRCDDGHFGLLCDVIGWRQQWIGLDGVDTSGRRASLAIRLTRAATPQTRHPGCYAVSGST